MAPDNLKPLYFVSSSRNKFDDHQFLLGKYADLRWSKQIIDEPNTMDLDILIWRKIDAAKPLLPHLPFLVEQTVLLIKSWWDLPGNMTGLFMDSVGNQGVCRMMESYKEPGEREAQVITDLGYHAPDGRVHLFRGRLYGHIADAPRGGQGFGWDAIFIPREHNQTFAEMSMEKKNSLSTRMLAVKEFNKSVLGKDQGSQVAQNRIILANFMVKHFNKTELEELCFSLGIDIEEALPDTVKREQVRELILFCDRRSRIDDLLVVLRAERPNVEWPDLV